ncbi:unnamed protein product, partial [Hapterophycus canaliculatus]
IERRFDWQASLAAAASLLAADDVKYNTEEALGGERMPFNKPPLLATTVHMAPGRVSVHQRCADGATEGSSVQYAMGKQHPSVQDAFVIFTAHPAGSERFVQRSRAVVSGDSTCSEAHVAMSAGTISSKKMRKTKKDPRGPRGYVSDFNFYVKAKRPAYVRDAQVDSAHANNEINKELGKAWKRATVEERNHFKRLAEMDKARYVEVRQSVY